MFYWFLVLEIMLIQKLHDATKESKIIFTFFDATLASLSNLWFIIAQYNMLCKISIYGNSFLPTSSIHTRYLAVVHGQL